MQKYCWTHSVKFATWTQVDASAHGNNDNDNDERSTKWKMETEKRIFNENLNCRHQIPLSGN